MMWDFNSTKAVGLVLRTWPYLMLRLVFFGLSALVMVTIIASIGILGHQFGPQLTSSLNGMQSGLLGVIFGVPFGLFVVRKFREYSLFLVKAAHVAVMVRLMDGGSFNGKSQLAFGTCRVREKFSRSSALFALDQLINCALKRTRTCMGKMSGSIPGAGILVGNARSVAEYSVSFIDEIILAHNMRARKKNAWDSSADAIVLYAQNRGVMIKNAAWLTVFLFVFGGLVTFLAIGPMLHLFADMAGPSFIYALISSVAIAIVLIEVVLEPFAIAALSEVFFKVTAGQSIEPELELKLDRVSEQFGLLRDRAAEKSTKILQQM